MIIRKLNYHEQKFTFSFQSTALVRWLGCEPVTTEIMDQKKSLWGKNQAPNSHLNSFMLMQLLLVHQIYACLTRSCKIPLYLTVH